MPNVLVTGGAMIAMGKYWASDYPGLALPAVLGAMESARITPKQIDAVYCGHAFGGMLTKGHPIGLPEQRKLSRPSGSYAGSAGTDRSPTPAWEMPMPQMWAFPVLITVLSRFVFFQTKA